MRRGMRRICAGLIVLSGLAAGAARAADEVDVALVLVADVSRSIDDSEFALEKTGYRQAFTNPTVLNAIRAGPLGQIAVAYVEFASSLEVKTVVHWAIVRDAGSAGAFAKKLEAAPRSYWGRTAIGAGIDHAVSMLTETGFNATRRVIDVSGDGTNNAGREARLARDDAVAAGITINGLAIINEHPVSWTFAHVQPPGGLPNYYRENVAGGPGGFVLEVRDFRSFGEAMAKKLIAEIACRPPGEKLTIRIRPEPEARRETPARCVAPRAEPLAGGASGPGPLSP